MAEIFNYWRKQVLEIWAKKNVIKDKIAGRHDVVVVYLKKLQKKLKLKSQDQKSKFLKRLQTNKPKRIFSHSCDFILNFFAFFTKNLIEFIDLFGHFVFYEILCSSNFLCGTSPRSCSWGSPSGWFKISFYKTYRYLP